MTGDLHCHTKLSDGSVGIEELIFLAKKSKLEAIAITDHDTLAGTTRGVVIGERNGIKVIPGVEFSAYDYRRNNKAHILCYLSDSPDRLEGLCKRVSNSRRRAGQMMLIKAMQRFPISAEHVSKCNAGSTNIFKQHIMHALMNAGFADSIFGELYQMLFSEPGGLINVKMDYPDVLEVLTAVHDAGGIAVLAHPAVYDNFELIPELAAAGLDGVEVWHPRHTEEETETLKKMAEKHRLLMTGGSDFHGMYSGKPTPIGSVLTPDDAMDELLNYKVRQKRIKRIAAI